MDKSTVVLQSFREGMEQTSLRFGFVQIVRELSVGYGVPNHGVFEIPRYTKPTSIKHLRPNLP